MSDEPFQVLLWIEGRERPVKFEMAHDDAVDFVERFVASDPDRARSAFGTDPTTLPLGDRSVLRTAFARAFAANAVGIASKRISPVDSASSWVIRGDAIQYMQVVDPDEVPPDPPRPKLGFKIDAGLITTPPDDVP